jgi:hypothetical protein
MFKSIFPAIKTLGVIAGNFEYFHELAIASLETARHLREFIGGCACQFPDSCRHIGSQPVAHKVLQCSDRSRCSATKCTRRASYTRPLFGISLPPIASRFSSETESTDDGSVHIEVNLLIGVGGRMANGIIQEFVLHKMSSRYKEGCHTALMILTELAHVC